MRVECKVIEVKTMLVSQEVQYYFKVEDNGEILYWVTASDKAWDKLLDAKLNDQKVILTSFKLDGTFRRPADGEKVQIIKNVRFKVSK